MRDTIARLTAPVFDRLPDISHAPPRRQISIGLIASLAVHALVLLLALLIGLLLPQQSLINFAKPKAQLQEIELTVEPPKRDDSARIVSPQEIRRTREFLESRGLAISDHPPDEPLFESDEDMIAASELPASGSAPLPTQEGRVDEMFPAFATQQVLLGKQAVPFPADVSLNTPKPRLKPPRVRPRTEPIPEPKPDQEPPGVMAQNAPPLRAEERTLQEVAKPAEAQIAFAKKQLVPPEPAAPEADAAPPERWATPSRPRASGYQPQLRKTQIDGSITNQGKAAVDAVATPMGTYKRGVNAAIGSRWYYYTNKRMSLIAPGTAMVSFTIDPSGRVRNVKTTANSSNRTFADLCEQAVREAELTPPPVDGLDPAIDGRLDYTVRFTFNDL